MPQISKEKIEHLLCSDRLYKADVAMLKALLDQPEGEPVGMHLSTNPENAKFVYTHPAPFTPITADDVPKQLVRDLWITGEITSLTKGAETIATFVNAYMGAKK
jgi:hypothetical protein